MKNSVKFICSKFCHKLNEINHLRYFNSKHFSSMNLACLMFFAFNIMVCASGVDEKPLLHPLFADHAVLQRDAGQLLALSMKENSWYTKSSKHGRETDIRQQNQLISSVMYLPRRIGS